MKPILILLLDSYRMLRSQAIFWITLSITGIVALVYLSIGFDENGMTFLFGLTGFESEVLSAGGKFSEVLYMGIFSKFIVGLWLSWIAIILALISCASVFPTTMEEGSAGVMMTKAPRRLTVFAVKFFGSLLFVFIQVTLFTSIVFIAMKWRTDTWNPTVFWYVPLVLLVFIYLYSFLTLVAVWTRSALVAVLLTAGFWATIFVVGFAKFRLYELSQMNAQVTSEQNSNSFENWYKMTSAVHSVFPKTTGTLNIGDDLLVVNGKKGFRNEDFIAALFGEEEAELEAAAESAGNTAWYTIGSSLLFSGILLGLAAWLFCRRDY